MVGLSVSQRMTPQWSFEEDIVFLSQAGIRGIGLWRRKLLEVGEEKAVELLSESSLQPLYIDWAGGFTGSHGWSYRQAIDEATRFIEFAARLRAPMVILHSGARGRHTFNHSRRILREALKELQPVAKANGVWLALEPVHPNDPENLTYVQTMAEAMDFVAFAGEGNVKLVCDLGHLGLDPVVFEQVDRWIRHVALVQLADVRPVDGQIARVPLGHGVVPVARILRQLVNHGYQGPFDLEIWTRDPKNQGPQHLIEEAKEFFIREIKPLLTGYGQPAASSTE